MYKYPQWEGWSLALPPIVSLGREADVLEWSFHRGEIDWGEFGEPDDLGWWRPESTGIGDVTDALAGFVALADMPTSAFPDRVLEYAQVWGPLYICEHSLPVSHVPKDHCLPVGWPDNCRDPLMSWRKYTTEFQAILWKGLYSEAEPPGVDDDNEVSGFLEDSQSLVSRVNDLLILGDVRVTIALLHDDYAGLPDNLFGRRDVPTGLFGFLALHLFYAITGRTLWALCSSCSGIYRPTRRPAHGQRKYCQACRDQGVPSRDANRAYLTRRQLFDDAPDGVRGSEDAIK